MYVRTRGTSHAHSTAPCCQAPAEACGLVDRTDPESSSAPPILVPKLTLAHVIHQATLTVFVEAGIIDIGCVKSTRNIAASI